MTDAPEYPGGSKKRVSRAGDAVRKGDADIEDVAVIEEWRRGHRHVINSFQALLRNRTRGKGIVVAQRHKRKKTIYGKLQRQPKMMLHRMDDIAGCRLIFQDIDQLYVFREKLHRARFKHQLRNEPARYDYIEHPKEDGYRGIHDVYIYDGQTEQAAPYKGLLIELQYRTIYQHAWATTVEVVGHITSSNPKFHEGDKRYQQIMALASELIAREWERAPGPLPDLSDFDLFRQFRWLDEDLQFRNMLYTLKYSDDVLKEGTTFILTFSENSPLMMETFDNDAQAIDALFAMESSERFKDSDIVLVQGSRAEVRTAFKNYFSDATDFLQYIDQALINIEARAMKDPEPVGPVVIE